MRLCRQQGRHHSGDEEISFTCIPRRRLRLCRQQGRHHSGDEGISCTSIPQNALPKSSAVFLTLLLCTHHGRDDHSTMFRQVIGTSSVDTSTHVSLKNAGNHIVSRRLREDVRQEKPAHRELEGNCARA